MKSYEIFEANLSTCWRSPQHWQPLHKMNPAWDKVEFDQEYETKNEPITVVFLLSESLDL